MSPNLQSDELFPTRGASLRTLSQVPVNLSPEFYHEQNIRRKLGSIKSDRDLLISPSGNIVYNSQIPVPYPIIIPQKQSSSKGQKDTILQMVKKQNQLLEKFAGKVNSQAQQLMKNEAKLLQGKLNKLQLDKQMQRNFSPNKFTSMPRGSPLLDWREILLTNETNKKRESALGRLQASPLIEERKNAREKEKKRSSIIEFIDDYNNLDQFIRHSNK